MRTIFIYAFIIIFAMLMGLWLNYFSKKNNKHMIKILYLLSFLLLLFFLAFNDSSSDFYAYVDIYNLSTYDKSNLPSDEVGYVFLNALIKTFIKNPIAGVNIIRGITLFIYFAAIYSLRKRINLGFSLVAFVLLSYFPIYTMLAYMLASALVFLAWTFFYHKKIIAFIMTIIIATLIHYTALLMIVPIVILLLGFKGDKPRWVFIYVVICACIASLFFVNQLLSVVLKYVPIFSKYSMYFIKSNYNSGLMQLFNYLPLIICIMFFREYFDYRAYKLLVALTIAGLLYGQISYSFINLQRVYTYFLFSYIIIISSFIKNKFTIIKTNHFIMFKRNILLEGTFFVLFFMLRCYLNFSTFWISSGFNDYHFIGE